MSNQPVKATLVQDHPKDSSALLIAVASVFLMGLGQFLNRQWAKGVLFLAIPLLFVGIEFGTGSWDKMDQGYHSEINHTIG
jgi:TM2 domain-containing membrane protein YozV